MKRNNLFIQSIGWGLLILLVLSPVLLSARPVCGRGDIVTINEKFSDFDKLEISHSFDVTINYSKDYSVTVKVDENLTDYLVVEKRGKTLKIGLKDGFSFRNIHLEAEITMPDIRRLGLSGATVVTIAGYGFSHPFDMNLSGVSKVIGKIQTGDLDLQLTGASKVKLNGRGHDLKIRASGVSTVKMDNFHVNDAGLSLSGSSNCRVNIGGHLNINASGSSTIEYCGSGEIGSIETSGSSRIRRI